MTLSRRQLSDRAIELVGGQSGVTKSYDPDGFFHMVTEGQQRTWVDATGKKRSYSACQCLFSRLALEACDMKQGMPWCNRVDGGNKWIPGQNLIRLKNWSARSGVGWKEWRANQPWLASLGDAVEINGKYGPHLFVITELHYGDGGQLTSLDRAEYGQFFIGKDGKSEHGAKLRLGSLVTKNAVGKWCVDGSPVIGHVDMMGLAEHEAAGDAVPVVVAQPAVIDPIKPTAPPQTLLPGDKGEAVRVMQTLLNAAGIGVTLLVDGDMGPKSVGALKVFQTKRHLDVDGVCGKATWAALGAAS